MFSPASHQYWISAMMVVMAMLATIFAYHSLQGGWVAYRQGEAYYASGAYELAIQSFDEALVRGITVERVVPRLAELHERTGHPDLALQVYHRVTDPARLGYEPLLHWANLLGRAKRYDEAEAIYRRLLARDSSNNQTRLALATLYAWAGRFDESIALYHSLLAEHPDNRVARLGMARVLGWRGDIGAAITAYRELLKKDKK